MPSNSQNHLGITDPRETSIPIYEGGNVANRSPDPASRTEVQLTPTYHAPRLDGEWRYPGQDLRLNQTAAQITYDHQQDWISLHNPQGAEFQSFTMYKWVDKKIRPVSTTFSPDYEIRRRIPEDPLQSLPILTATPPPFTPTQRLDYERLKILDINSDGFLTSEEEQLFI
ncbi:hypothetical protein C8R44DRAFT_734236 [Mycena epipterygia]|nr:hypothetical protein C8R44DRAFT_734236 [Mycena epipterygia]